MQDQLQGSDPTALQRKKQKCNKITCQLSREMMLLLLQTRVRFRQTSTTHLSAAIYNTVVITICPHYISPGFPPAAAETTGQKKMCVPQPRSDKPQNLWEEGHKQKIPSSKAWGVGWSSLLSTFPLLLGNFRKRQGQKTKPGNSQSSLMSFWSDTAWWKPSKSPPRFTPFVSSLTLLSFPDLTKRSKHKTQL